MGAPGTGKTTLACAMKEYALLHNVSSDICTEYAREFCFKYGVPRHPYAQYRIPSEQIERENLFMKGNNEYIFCDSPIWLGYVFGLVNFSHEHNEEVRDIISDLYGKFVIKQMNRYYRVFHIKNDKPHDDGCRIMEINRKIADVIDGFAISHKHMLPIVTIDIDIMDTEGRKKFVWDNLRDGDKKKD